MKRLFTDRESLEQHLVQGSLDLLYLTKAGEVRDPLLQNPQENLASFLSSPT